MQIERLAVARDQQQAVADEFGTPPSRMVVLLDIDRLIANDMAQFAGNNNSQGETSPVAGAAA